jgi:PAS domain S-box-containing protein
VTTAPRRRLDTRTQCILVAVCLPAWIAITHVLPILSSMPGVVVLVGLITIAFTFDRGPALLGVAIGAVGHELIRNAAPWPTHVSRMIVVALIGGVAVALAYGRTARLIAARRYQALFDRHPLPMIVFDEATLAILSVNAATVRTYGYTDAEFCRMSLREISGPDEAPLPQILPPPSNAAEPVLMKHVTRTGQALDVQIRIQTVPFQGRQALLMLVEDITGQRELEGQFRQAQKMEAVGRLAGGVAHDFNNLLTAIRGYTSLLLDSLPEDDVRREDVLEIEKASARATELTRQLLAFSRKQIFQERVISLNDIVQEIAPMLRQLTREQVELRVRTQARGHVKTDPAQMQQVIMNLVVNARDAVGTGGEIIVETADVVLDELYTRTHAAATVGPHVVLAVSDNGHGMSQEVQARAFEPFFTTKAAGAGTGLGLSTVYGIVKQSGGHLWIYSEVGRGTTIKVYLPRAMQERDEPPAVPELPREPVATPTSVLVVEDEETVRTLLAKVLTRSGYTVFTAASAAEAAALVDDRQVVIDLLVTDVVLSRESGRELAILVTRAQPHARVLYISGYTDDAVVRHGILTEQMPFLQKPFTAAALLEKVASIMAAPSA